MTRPPVWKDYSDEKIREIHAEASAIEARTNNVFSRRVHRKRRLEAERELRRRGMAG